MSTWTTEAQRVVVVSNRLPFTVVQGDEEVRFQEVAGGLATGLRALLAPAQSSRSAPSDYVWVGWPGRTIGNELRESIRTKALSEFGCYPVFLSAEDFENFYQGFCNKTLWPLFHYFPTYARYNPEYWDQYRKVNESFRATLLEVIRPDDTVWIHDYHLMLLPHLLRRALPKLRIGFFLHIPFPQFEIFRLLPGTWRREILEGLLGADLVGFHTHDYTEYFLRCVQRILGHEHQMGQLLVGDRLVRAGTFPMGIDFRKFYATASTEAVQIEIGELQRKLGDSKLILSVDRQDYSKGIIHRLQGFQAMLQANPEWRGKVTLVMIVVPSRIGIEHYEGMKKRIEELVGKINGEFGTVGWTPIVYQYRAIPFHSLVALYATSHVALVTPLRDGMNLVAKEYIASKLDKTGVLVISEMAGAAKELPEAIIINPNNREEISEALKTALEMPREEQVHRNEIMQNRLRRCDVGRWATDFLIDLLSSNSVHEKIHAQCFRPVSRQALIREYRQSIHRLLVFDYDGTLVPFAASPELAKPTSRLLGILRDLTEESSNEVILATGRDRATVDHWFNGLPLGFAAEHGIWVKERTGDWRTVNPLDGDWKEKLFPILEMHADRVPGAFVEEKEFSLAWHYRRADPAQGEAAARELTDHLLAFTANISVQVLQGSKVIEIRNAGINKGVGLNQWLSKTDFDFILAIGDSWTDQDMFTALPPTAYTFRVGTTPIHARFSLQDPAAVLELLEELIMIDDGARNVTRGVSAPRQILIPRRG